MLVVFIAFVIGALVGVLGGGYGGYKYGASVERKAAAQLQALAQSAVKVVGKV
jgi:hypothetical protein